VSERAPLRIVPVDPEDTDAFDRWYDAYLAAERAVGPAACSPWARAELRVMLAGGGSRRWTGAFAGLVGDRVVAAGRVETPLLDNLATALVAVHVDPAHGRRGYAAAMLDHLEEVARGRGRTVLVAEALWPHGAGPTGDGVAGPDFLRAHGYELVLGNEKRILRLPVDDGRLAELADGAAGHHASYTLRTVTGPVPDDLVDGLAALASTLMTEAPMGERQLEAERITAAELREDEELLRRQGRTKYTTVALDAAGAVVAYTDLAVTVHEPGRAYQWGTLVRPGDRGHRLGLAVKVANLRLLQRESPQSAVLVTFNADSNEPMIAVNDLLGFEPTARLGELQKRLRSDEN
jgi:GNAT superfamily N-acetyltransferase